MVLAEIFNSIEPLSILQQLFFVTLAFYCVRIMRKLHENSYSGLTGTVAFVISSWLLSVFCVCVAFLLEH